MGTPDDVHTMNNIAQLPGNVIQFNHCRLVFGRKCQNEQNSYRVHIGRGQYIKDNDMTCKADRLYRHFKVFF